MCNLLGFQHLDAARDFVGRFFNLLLNRPRTPIATGIVTVMLTSQISELNEIYVLKSWCQQDSE